MGPLFFLYMSSCWGAVLILGHNTRFQIENKVVRKTHARPYYMFVLYMYESVCTSCANLCTPNLLSPIDCRSYVSSACFTVFILNICDMENQLPIGI